MIELLKRWFGLRDTKPVETTTDKLTSELVARRTALLSEAIELTKEPRNVR